DALADRLDAGAEHLDTTGDHVLHGLRDALAATGRAGLERGHGLWDGGIRERDVDRPGRRRIDLARGRGVRLLVVLGGSGHCYESMPEKNRATRFSATSSR